MREHPAVGILGCKVMNPDGTEQPSARELPTLWTLFLENSYLYKRFSHSGLFRNPWITEVEKEQEVDVVKGAFLLSRREVLDQVGGMDEQFFLYSEEQDLCLRVKQSGWKVVYLPIAGILHVEGGSSLPGPNSARLVVFESEYKYFKKHKGVLYAKGACLIMLVGSLMRIIAWWSLVGVRILRRQDVAAAKARALSYWYSLGRLLSILVRFHDGAKSHGTS
jgi:GT2 family glycosyltransferase